MREWVRGMVISVNIRDLFALSKVEDETETVS